jgi:hypothetical protein
MQRVDVGPRPSALSPSLIRKMRRSASTIGRDFPSAALPGSL